MLGLWHVNYASGVDYQDQTSMPDDTGLGINQPMVEANRVCSVKNGFPEIQVLVGSRFERESGYQPLTDFDQAGPMMQHRRFFFRAEPIQPHGTQLIISGSPMAM